MLNEAHSSFRLVVYHVILSFWNVPGRITFDSHASLDSSGRSVSQSPLGFGDLDNFEECQSDIV